MLVGAKNKRFVYTKRSLWVFRRFTLRQSLLLLLYACFVPSGGFPRASREPPEALRGASRGPPEVFLGAQKHVKTHGFCTYLLSWASKGPRWPKMAPRWPRIAPRWPKIAPRWPHGGPNRAQHGPKMAPRLLILCRRRCSWVHKNKQKHLVFALFCYLGLPTAHDGPRWPQDGPR